MVRVFLLIAPTSEHEYRSEVMLAHLVQVLIQYGLLGVLRFVNEVQKSLELHVLVVLQLLGTKLIAVNVLVVQRRLQVDVQRESVLKRGHKVCFKDWTEEFFFLQLLVAQLSELFHDLIGIGRLLDEHPQLVRVVSKHELDRAEEGQIALIVQELEHLDKRLLLLHASVLVCLLTRLKVRILLGDAQYLRVNSADRHAVEEVSRLVYLVPRDGLTIVQLLVNTEVALQNTLRVHL